MTKLLSQAEQNYVIQSNMRFATVAYQQCLEEFKHAAVAKLPHGMETARARAHVWLDTWLDALAVGYLETQFPSLPPKPKEDA